MDNLKKAAAEASSFFNRAKQFTGEKLGGADKTNYDAGLELLIKRSENTKAFTERIISTTTSVLQPNPNERIEDFLFTKLEFGKQQKPNQLESLGQCLAEASAELANQHQYGHILNKVGEVEKRLGQFEKDFVQKSSDCLLQPLKSFLDGQMKTIQKEKRTLEIKRLDLDACKARVKKLTEANPVKLDAEEELRIAQTEFDRQCELTKLLMDEINVSYNHHLQCLTDFVDAQLNYYNNCTKVLQDLSRQIGGTGIANASNSRAMPPTPSLPPSAVTTNPGQLINLNMSNTEALANLSLGNHHQTSPAPAAPSSLQMATSNKKKAKVLIDYEATDSSELTVTSNQLVPNENDWVLAESGRDAGKVPKAYIQIID